MSPEAWTAAGTWALVVATAILAIVAGVQIGESRKSAREIFARQSRQHYFDISLRHPKFAARDVDLADLEEREGYFTFLSVLFSAADDAMSFLSKTDRIFSDKVLAEDITSHLLFITAHKIDDWRFHFGRNAISIMAGSSGRVIEKRTKIYLRMKDELDALAESMKSFGLSSWITIIDRIIEPLQPEIMQSFVRWDSSTPQLKELDSRPWGELERHPDYKNLPEGAAEMVHSYLALKLRLSVNEVGVKLFTEMRERLMQELADA